MTSDVKTHYAEGIEVRAAVSSEFAEILTPEALDFIAKLARSFEDRRQELLARRPQRQASLDAGNLPDFLPETAQIPASIDQSALTPRRAQRIDCAVDREAFGNSAEIDAAGLEQPHRSPLDFEPCPVRRLGLRLVRMSRNQAALYGPFAGADDVECIFAALRPKQGALKHSRGPIVHLHGRLMRKPVDARDAAVRLVRAH